MVLGRYPVHAGYRHPLKPDWTSSLSGTHLWCDAAPEVGVGPRGVQHGSHDRLVLGNQEVEGVGVGEDVVRVGELRK